MLSAKCSPDGRLDPSKKIDMGTLTPCQKCLYQHIRRANYQIGIWKQAHIAEPGIPNLWMYPEQWYFRTTVDRVWHPATTACRNTGWKIIWGDWWGRWRQWGRKYARHATRWLGQWLIWGAVADKSKKHIINVCKNFEINYIFNEKCYRSNEK